MDRRILIIANKSWEADPLVGVLLSPSASPDLGEVRIVRHPFQRQERRHLDPEAKPRIEVQPATSVVVEVWCLEDLMDPEVSSSSTAEKVRVLPRARRYRERPPDLVVALGTAAAPAELDLVGCAVVGSRVFVHDPFADRPDREDLWRPSRPDRVIDSPPLPGGLFRRLGDEVRERVEPRLLRPPLRPAAHLTLVAAEARVGLSNANITDYADYAWADHQLMQHFRKVAGVGAQVGSVETTHGVVRQLFEAPFLYVSGIANRIGFFDVDVAPRTHAQNFVAAHNAGVALAWLIPQLFG